ncbi:hypothetical protein SAMN05192540_3850 [Maribacter dokdonensis]|uniref:Uncharacterized protein n=1 Tax=Maribacter dokdonensis TaxID=320912 RepID=A0A1H4UQ97_9FLAO|nr:hypothetical protein SAMN05192540_3850 [Maribacter dokdonensis]
MQYLDHVSKEFKSPTPSEITTFQVIITSD